MWVKGKKPKHFVRPRGFWGKLSETGYLPLACHCLDVALCFRSLCELRGTRRALENAAGRSLNSRDLDRLAVLAALHDFGKANRGFQYKPFDEKAPNVGHVRELAPLLDSQAADPELTHNFLEALGADALAGWFASDGNAYSYFLAVVSHHGRPLRFSGERTGIARAAKAWWQPDDQLAPMQGVAEIVAAARLAFPDACETGGDHLPAAPVFHHRFAGLVMLADWLGSHSGWFPITPVTPEERIRHNRNTIPRMLRAVGLDCTEFPLQYASFEQRFLRSPRPLQALIDRLSPADPVNRLLIAESETGSGKTEAALHWFGKLFASGQVDSLYFALPTRVAARELYQRIVETIERWFPDPQARPVTVLAVPGYAEADSLPVEKCLPDEKTRWVDEKDQQRLERRWAAEHPKRFLAATVAVGTIDQALLSVVQTGHAHLRSICLDRALLVVDEVHASDVYMSRLLEHLLRHHLSIGGRALLLSATLGSVARYRYLTAAGVNCSAHDQDTASNLSYPSLTDASATLTEATRSDQSNKPKFVTFETVSDALHPERLVEKVAVHLQRGARVLVVMNTVGRAIALQQAVENCRAINPEWLFNINGVCCPHHGRFAAIDRMVLDKAVSAWLGQDSVPGPMLLIGTQTLEQSLDIDADLLITDLAPADVLLQRVGRLHRHRRERPSEFEKPRCVVLVPDEPFVELLDDRGKVNGQYGRIGYGTVYPDLRILALTLEAIRIRPDIEVPRDNRWLVERATHPEALTELGNTDKRWQNHGQGIDGDELMQALQAGSALVDFGKLFGEFEFNEHGGRVATRLGAGSWRLPLEREVTSPFGQTLKELQIPDHLAVRSDQEQLQIIAEDTDGLILRWGDARYRYSRLGLEKMEKETS